MKKIVLTLSVLLVLILALAMTSCGGNTETTTEAPVTTEAPLPEGYTLYDNGDISFAYPDNLSKTDGSTVILLNLINGNNITVVYEAKTDMYAKMDNNDYAELFKPMFEEMGMTIAKYNVEQIKNAKGISLTKVTHTASTQGKTMEQTMLITTVGNKTYTVTVTEVVNDDAFVNNVLNSLGLAK